MDQSGGRARTPDVARSPFRNQLAVVAGIAPVVGFVLVVDRAVVQATSASGLLLLFGSLVVAAWAGPTDDRRVFASLLAADVAAIALIRADEPSVGVSALFALPAVWAGYAFGARGAAAVTTVVTAILWWGAPGDWDVLDAQDTARLIAFPLVTAAVSGTAAALTARSAARQRLLVAQSSLLDGALREVSARERLVTAVLDSVDFTVVAFDEHSKITVGGGRRPDVLHDLTAPPAPGDGSPRRAVMARALLGEELDDEVVAVRRSDGSTRSYAVSSRQFDADGATGGVLVARDVTAEQQALRARDDLVASVSHELRTPTTAILGSVELARDAEGLPEDAERLLEVAARNAERLVELVGGIMQSAREEHVDLVLGPCDLVDVARAALESAGPAAAAAGVTIRLTASTPPSVSVRADAFRMRQVLDNLVSNAIKYNRSGGSVEVGVTAFDDRVWIIVRDDGIGIAEADQDRLFERFFRAESARASTAHGTGLGLAICRRIVRRHAGDLTITSSLGDGTTATVVMPVDPEVAA